jgi:hypothetical protein
MAVVEGTMRPLDMMSSFTWLARIMTRPCLRMPEDSISTASCMKIVRIGLADSALGQGEKACLGADTARRIISTIADVLIKAGVALEGGIGEYGVGGWMGGRVAMIACWFPGRKFTTIEGCQ